MRPLRSLAWTFGQACTAPETDAAAARTRQAARKNRGDSLPYKVDATVAISATSAASNIFHQLSRKSASTRAAQTGPIAIAISVRVLIFVARRNSSHSAGP